MVCMNDLYRAGMAIHVGTCNRQHIVAQVSVFVDAAACARFVARRCGFAPPLETRTHPLHRLPRSRLRIVPRWPARLRLRSRRSGSTRTSPPVVRSRCRSSTARWSPPRPVRMRSGSNDILRATTESGQSSALRPRCCSAATLSGPPRGSLIPEVKLNSGPVCQAALSSWSLHARRLPAGSRNVNPFSVPSAALKNRPQGCRLLIAEVCVGQQPFRDLSCRVGQLDHAAIRGSD